MPSWKVNVSCRFWRNAFWDANQSPNELNNPSFVFVDENSSQISGMRQ